MLRRAAIDGRLPGRSDLVAGHVERAGPAGHRLARPGAARPARAASRPPGACGRLCALAGAATQPTQPTEGATTAWTRRTWAPTSRRCSSPRRDRRRSWPSWPPRSTRDYAGKDLLLVGVLKGAVMVMADLARALGRHVEMDWMAVSSYGSGTKSSGVVRILKDLDRDITGRHVLIVEDIIDSGLTLSWLMSNLGSRGPGLASRSARCCASRTPPRSTSPCGTSASTSPTSSSSATAWTTPRVPQPALRRHARAARLLRLSGPGSCVGAPEPGTNRATAARCGVSGAPSVRSDSVTPRARAGVPSKVRLTHVIRTGRRDGATRPGSMDVKRYFRGPVIWVVLVILAVLLVDLHLLGRRRLQEGRHRQVRSRRSTTTRSTKAKIVDRRPAARARRSRTAVKVDGSDQDPGRLHRAPSQREIVNLLQTSTSRPEGYTVSVASRTLVRR